jgi:voltage-gated potassium channel Kch
MQKARLIDRLRYQFDNTMSRGPIGLIMWLALIAALMVLGAAVFVLLAGNDADKDWPTLLWDLIFQTLTPNPVDTGAGSVTFLGTMFCATLGSLFMVSILIGILTNAIDHRIQDLRKGRSRVIESGHTLLLGWSSQIYAIIAELVVANANRRDACIVLLAENDKIEMEDAIRAKLPRTGRTRIVCRTGSPLDQTDLEIVNPHTARSIIILPPEGKDPDTSVIKTMLALTNNAHRKEGPYNIVAAVNEPSNMDIARMVGRDEVSLVQIIELISRVTVQTCRQVGLSVVYTELLNFEGDEIYFKAEPGLTGKSFGAALFAYEDSAVIGLQRTDGRLLLNPPPETLIERGDLLIAIAADDDTIKLGGQGEAAVDERAILTGQEAPRVPERTLILGWNHHAPRIINGLDHYVAPGSQTLVVARAPLAEAQIGQLCQGLLNEQVSFSLDDSTSRRALDALAIPSFQHVIVLSNSDEADPQDADAQTLITLLHLRDIRERTEAEFSIVSEMLDVRNRHLADVTRADDFIVSDQLVGLVLAQVSENRSLNALFEQLFTPEGSEVYLKAAGDYVRLGQAVNFYTVVESARRRCQVAIGYRLHRNAHDAIQSYGVVVNPGKADLLTFEGGDKIIVLAEH